MTKDLRKVIMKNKCNSLTKKSRTDLFKENTNAGTMTSKKFGRTVKPFLKNDGCLSNDFIDIDNEGNQICNEQEFVQLDMNINEHYTNIVENPYSKIPLSLVNSSYASQYKIKWHIISVYSNHPSIRKMYVCLKNKFDLPYASTSDINKIIKSQNVS